MKTIHKILAWLLAPLVLAGCGVAGGPGEVPAEPDTTPPQILQATPPQGAVVEPDQIHIEIVFSEAIDPTILNAALTVSAGNAPVLGDWNYDPATFTVSFQPQQPFPLNSQISVSVTPTVTDQAGNALISGRTWTFRTPRLYTLRIRGNGLISGTNLEILEAESGQSIQVNSNGTFSFSDPLQEGHAYRLAIAQTNIPADAALTCLLGQEAGTLNSDTTIDLYCTRVTALYPNAGADWNDYLANDGATIFSASDQPCSPTTADYDVCLHGGELRRFPLDGTSDCSGITAQDDLGAFHWQCRVTDGGQVEVVSVALKEDKGLRDLIDFQRFGWALNRVRVFRNGQQIAESSPGIWWTTPVREADAVILTGDGTVYAVGEGTPSRKFKFYNRSGAALVSAPGVSLRSDDSDPTVEIQNSQRLWIEVQVDAAGKGEYGIDVTQSVRVVLRHVSVTGASKHGLRVNNASVAPDTGHLIQDLTSHHNGGDGLRLSGSHITLRQARSYANGGHGLVLAQASHNHLEDIRSAANGGHGLLLDRAEDNRLQHLASYANVGDGIRLEGGGDNRLLDVISTGNGGDGIILTEYAGYGSINNLFLQLTVARNGGNGLTLISPSDPNGSVDNQIRALASAGNGSTGLNGSGNNRFAESQVDQCAGTCPSGVTDGLTLVTFLGELSQDDSVNGDDVGGVAYANQIDDWTGFEHDYRTWGADGGPGTCLPNARCRIHDWSLSASDTRLLGALPLPTGDDSVNHVWSDASQTTFLAHALEEKAGGNGNGLCESGETCLYTPNIGAYPGHGTLIEQPFTDGAISGVTLQGHDQNGR